MHIFFYCVVLNMICFVCQLIPLLIIIGGVKIKIFNFLTINVHGIYDVFGDSHDQK